MLYSDLCQSFSVPRFKQRLCIVVPNGDSIYEILDAVKIADALVFIWPSDGSLSASGTLLLSAIFAQGLPTTVNLVQGLRSLNGKQREVAKKAVSKQLENW